MLVLLLYFSLNTLTGQEDSTGVNRNRLNLLIAGGSVAYAGTMTGLYFLWYQDYPQSSFHFTNDGREWMGMDKLGHVATSYWVGRISYQSLKWANVKDHHAIWIGGSMGLFFLTTVEIFDGFSAEWGASPADLIANVAGSGLFIGQQLGWGEQRISVKYSYHPTDYAQYRPDVLGKNAVERVIKDYNGQTFWLSANIHSFLRPGSRFPRWLNVAAGYGAEGMLGGSENPEEYNGTELPDFQRTSSYYLSLDVDLTRIPVRSKFLKGLFNIIGFVKIPFPTLEYNTGDQFRFHILYF